MAGFSNMYPNLPGMLVEFKDGGRALLSSNAIYEKTDSMLIIGTSIDGPVLEPVAVDISTAALIMGSDVITKGVSNGSTLIPAFKQAWDAGCRDIRLMRISGSVAKSTITADDSFNQVATAFTEPTGLKTLGNEAMVLQLGHPDVKPTSMKIFVDGSTSPMVTGYVEDDTAGAVSIAANQISAGVSLSVTYDYHTDITVTDEELTLSASRTVTTVNAISNNYDSDTVKFTKVTYNDGTNDVVIDPSLIVRTGSTLSIPNYAVGTPSVVGNKVKVTYKYLSLTTQSATENGVLTNPWKSQSGTQVIALSKTPNKSAVNATLSSVVLSVNSIVVPQKTAGGVDNYTVDAVTKELSFEKSLFPLNSSISISYMYDATSPEIEAIELTSIFGGDVYNGCKVAVKEVKGANGAVIDLQVELTKPDAKKAQVAEAPLVYSCNTYFNYQLLVTAINNDPMNNVFKASTNHPYSPSAELKLQVTPVSFSGGDNGLSLSKEQLFVALSGDANTNGAYQLLENYSVDFVVPVGVYADDALIPVAVTKTTAAGTSTVNIRKNFAYELALFCAVLSYRNKTTLGAISMVPVVDTGLAGIKKYSDDLVNYDNKYLMMDLAGNSILDSSGFEIDLGKFISVVGGPEPTLFDASTLGGYFGNSAVSYVAMNTTMLASSAPTNKVIPGVKGIRFNFSNKQLDDISGNRIVTFKTKVNSNGQVNKAAYVVDAMTAVRKGSDYARITTMKVMRAVVDQLREVADPYIGEGVTVEQKNALASAISKRLGILKEKGFILDFSFSLVFKQLDTVVGEGSLELTLVPPQELKRITTMVSLKSSL